MQQRYDQMESYLKEWLLWKYGATTQSPYWPGHVIPKLAPDYRLPEWLTSKDFWRGSKVTKTQMWKVAQ